jgi:hypothetical protein
VRPKLAVIMVSDCHLVPVIPPRHSRFLSHTHPSVAETPRCSAPNCCCLAASTTVRVSCSNSTLYSSAPTARATCSPRPSQDGFLFLDRDKFHASFAGDRPAGQAACWYLVPTGDRMILRLCSGRWPSGPGGCYEVDASHSVYVSQPSAVASLIKQAAG